MVNKIMSSSGYARHFKACNRHDMRRYVPLSIGDKRYGHVAKDLAGALCTESSVFEPCNDGIMLSPALQNFGERSAALREATEWIAKQRRKPLRDEMYAVTDDWDHPPTAQVDRAAVPWFGIRAWGVHVNGFTRKKDGLHLWIGERAANRPADPGKLDNLIGGGQPIGLTVAENLCKEAKEEAGLEADLAMTAKAAGTINYRVERSEGLRSDTLFLYDLELSPDYVPRNTDGEVAAFHLLPIAEVARLVRDTDKFKFNCSLVIIDFLVRYGFITEKDGEYAELIKWLKP